MGAQWVPLAIVITFLLGGVVEHPAEASSHGRQILKACSSVAQIAEDAGLTVFIEAAKAANLSANLTDPNWAYTVLAPVNDAFEEAATSLNITLTELTSSPDLVHILENHLLAYPLTMEEMIVAGTVKTQYLFEPLRVMAEAVEDEALVTIFSPINSANVIKEDIKACKSYVHIIDGVLLPEL